MITAHLAVSQGPPRPCGAARGRDALQRVPQGRAAPSRAADADSVSSGQAAPCVASLQALQRQKQLAAASARLRPAAAAAEGATSPEASLDLPQAS